jgi:hypothetical protein
MAVRLPAIRPSRASLLTKFPGTHFCQRLSEPQGLVRLEGLDKLRKFSDFIGTRTREFPARKHNASTNYATACANLLDVA